MTADGIRRAMDRYFEVLGTDRFAAAVHPSVTWTTAETGHVVTGDADVGRHLDRLHAAMRDTSTRPLVVSDDVAILEGDCRHPGAPSERVAFCVVYEVADGRVSAMRAYGPIERLLEETRSRTGS